MAQRNPSRPLPAVKNPFRPLSNWIGHNSDFVTCPYDQTHTMKNHNLLLHLQKCEKQIKKRKDGQEFLNGFEKCPYDATHRFPKGSKDEHYRACKARGQELLSQYQSGESLEGLDEKHGF